jgi:NAD(P)-dependent dehydrogenase (short-subunit alcohol dehydrogenase family)
VASTWFVTGAGRGMGAEIARAALAAGHNVAATARDPARITRAFDADPTKLLALPLDVSNEGQVRSAVEAAVKHFGGLDVLVNNAGYGQLGVFEELSPDQVRAQFETNVFGLMAVTRAVIPLMRKQRHGRIFNISSVAGRQGVFGSSIYAASKFAVEGFSQGLAEELRGFGVFVTAVAPGFFRTDFLDPSSVQYEGHAPIAEYADGMKKFREFHNARNHTQIGDPAKLGALLVRLAKLDNPPAALVAGSDAVEWALSVIRNVETQIEASRELSVSTDGDWSDARTDALPAAGGR